MHRNRNLILFCCFLQAARKVQSTSTVDTLFTLMVAVLSLHYMAEYFIYQIYISGAQDAVRRDLIKQI